MNSRFTDVCVLLSRHINHPLLWSSPGRHFFCTPGKNFRPGFSLTFAVIWNWISFSNYISEKSPFCLVYKNESKDPSGCQNCTSEPKDEDGRWLTLTGKGYSDYVKISHKRIAFPHQREFRASNFTVMKEMVREKLDHLRQFSTSNSLKFACWVFITWHENQIKYKIWKWSILIRTIL